MKREILFKGKRADNGELVISDSLMQVKGQNPRLWVEFDGWVEVLPEIVGQFTGLTDKNGKKILEGNICRNIKTGQVMAVVWTVRKEYNQSLFDFGALFRVYDKFEVIGNVYDNPELLEGKQHEQRTVRRI